MKFQGFKVSKFQAALQTLCASCLGCHPERSEGPMRFAFSVQAAISSSTDFATLKL
jgi:hypothetical protein